MNARTYEVRRSTTRGQLLLDWLEARFSFSFGDYRDLTRDSFGALRVLNEDRIQPATGFGMHPHRDVEILLLPLAGAVAHADSLGNETVLRPGDAMAMRAGAGITHSQMNASSDVVDHHLQVWLTPRRPGLAPGIQVAHFNADGRRGRWQLIASDDGRQSSLAVDQDVLVWRARPRGDAPLAYRPLGARWIYLHSVRGNARFSVPAAGLAERLEAGDAIAWRGVEPFEVTAANKFGSELLLLDLSPDGPDALRPSPSISSTTS